METRVCENCGKEFRARKLTSRFCSIDCRRAICGAPQLYKCDYCGREFLVSSTKIKRKQSGYIHSICCSKECFDNLQGHTYQDVEELFDSRGYTLLTNHKVTAKEKYKYICPKHKDNGIQQITYNNLKNGHGCRFCGFERTAFSKKPDIQDVRKTFDERGLDLVSTKYIDSHASLEYICRKHKERGVQKISYTNLLSGQGCSYCRQSKGELEIFKFLSSHDILFECQKKFDGLLGIRGHLLSFDFFIPSMNLLIEYQGEFHDGSAHIQTNEKFLIQQEHDDRKRIYAQTHGYDLLEIWYYDKPRIPEILSNKLHQSVETAGHTQ